MRSVSPRLPHMERIKEEEKERLRGVRASRKKVAKMLKDKYGITKMKLED